MLLPYINYAMQQYDINHTKERVAMFLAQIGHESDEFKTFREYASGEAYEGRADLGNIFPGDGVKFRGRGAIQITGRYNYTQLAKELKIPCVERPEILEEPRYALIVSAWFWNSRKLNDIAGNLEAVTRKINGGLNGLQHRKILWERALSIL